MQKTICRLSIILLLVFMTVGCDTAQKEEPVKQNPVPQLSALSPTGAVAHLPQFTLTVFGSQFTSSSVIVFNGNEKETEFISSGELTCVVDPEDTVSAGAVATSGSRAMTAADLPVLVRNPAPGGGDSAQMMFQVLENHSFSAPAALSPGSGRMPLIELDGDSGLHMVWKKSSVSPAVTEYARSDDMGATWSLPGSFEFPVNKFYKHGLVADTDGNLLAAWNESGVKFSRSTDGGDSWQIPVQVWDPAVLGPIYYVNYVTVAVDASGVIYLAWSMYHTPEDEIYFSKSTDSGITWSAAKNISLNETLMGHANHEGNDVYRSDGPCLLATADGNIHLAWHYMGYYYGDPEYWETYFSKIFLIRSSDQGENWTLAQAVADTRNYSFYPSLEKNPDGMLSLGWHSQTYGEDSFASYCCQQAGGWTDAGDVDPSMNSSFYIDHKVDSAGNVNVVWCDKKTGNFEIYFSRSLDSGVTWSAPQNISSAFGKSQWPVLEVDAAGYVHIVWEDDRSGAYRIYYASSRP